MKKLLFYILLIFCAQNVKGQCYFQKIFDYNYQNQAFNAVTHTFDNGFFAIGGSHISTGVMGLYYLKTDSCGNKEWGDVISISPGGDFGYSVLQLIDSTYLIYGALYDSIEGASDCYLLKFDQFGNILWHKPIDAGYNDRAIMMKQLSDGNIILGGYFFDTLLTTTSTFLIKANTSGNVIWQKDYGANVYDYLYSIDITLDGGFILGGSTTTSFDYDHFLIKTDSLGNQQWRKKYGDNHTQYIGYVISLKGGGYLQSGYVNKNYTYYRGILRKTDNVGGLIWEKEIGMVNFSDIYTIKELSNGDILAVGDASIDSFPDEAPRVWISRLKENGEVIWERNYSYYGGITHTYASEFQILPDSSMIFAGFTIPVGQMDSSRNNGYLLRTDKKGCLIPGCDTIGTGIDTSTVGLYFNNNLTHFNIYPNPNNGKFEIDLNIDQQGDYTLEVRNVLGQRIYNEDLRNFSGPYLKRLDLSGHPKGTYLISLQGSDGEVVKRVVIF